jgi:glycosyltransferase-like protein
VKIALLSYSTKPRGGVVHTLALAEALAALGESVTVWTLGRDGDAGFFRPVHPSVSLAVVPFPAVDGESVGDRIIRSIAVLRNAFDPAGYDIVHAQDCISANAVDRCVRTVHHLDQFTTPELAACHERAIVEPYAHVCVSASVAAELRSGWGIQATVIPNGVDYDRFATASGDTYRDRYGRYVLAVGGIEPRKGSLELLAAYARLRTRLPDVRLVIAGGETLFDYRPYRAQWDARAAALSVTPEVLGAVPHTQLPALVAGASAFAFPSHKEGFGLAAMEALAAGVPTVVNDLPVLREIFRDTVRYAPTVDSLTTALIAALESPPNPAPGQSLARTYTWPTAARAHQSLYRTLRT